MIKDFIGWWEQIGLVIFFLIIAACGGDSATLVTVSGTLVDSAGTPVGGATVTITSDPIITTSNIDGFFSVQVPRGNHHLVAGRNGTDFLAMDFTADGDAPVALGTLPPTTTFFLVSFKLLSDDRYIRTFEFCDFPPGVLHCPDPPNEPILVAPDSAFAEFDMDSRASASQTSSVTVDQMGGKGEATGSTFIGGSSIFTIVFSVDHSGFLYLDGMLESTGAGSSTIKLLADGQVLTEYNLANVEEDENGTRVLSFNRVIQVNTGVNYELGAEARAGVRCCQTMGRWQLELANGPG